MKRLEWSCWLEKCFKNADVFFSPFSSCRLCEKDPFQLYQRLEQQAREYVLEMKVRLLKHLSTGPKTTGPVGVAAAQGPPQAYQFISLLLEEYSALCQAARTISSFLLTLVSFTPRQSESYCASCLVGDVELN